VCSKTGIDCLAEGDAEMGMVIELSDYRIKAPSEPRDGFRLEVVPPVMVVRQFRDGVLVGEERVVSEYMLREMLD
jgi:hypothetical protein